MTVYCGQNDIKDYRAGTGSVTEIWQGNNCILWNPDAMMFSTPGSFSVTFTPGTYTVILRGSGGAGGGGANHTHSYGGGAGAGCGGDADAGGGSASSGGAASNAHSVPTDVSEENRLYGIIGTFGQGGRPGQNGMPGCVYIKRTA